MYYPKLDIQRFIAQTSNKQGLIIFQPDTKDRSAVGDHRGALVLFAHVKYVFIKIYRV